jgi:hypothetical protein
VLDVLAGLCFLQGGERYHRRDVESRRAPRELQSRRHDGGEIRANPRVCDGRKAVVDIVAAVLVLGGSCEGNKAAASATTTHE